MNWIIFLSFFTCFKDVKCGMCEPTYWNVVKPLKIQAFTKEYKISLSHGNFPSKCSKDVSYQWRMVQLLDNTQPDLSHFLKFRKPRKLNSTNFLQITDVPITNRFFYLTKVELSCSILFPDGKSPEKTSAFFYIEAYDMVITMEGGAYREHDMALNIGVLQFNATGSKDKSFTVERLVPSAFIYNITWGCTPPIPGNTPPTGGLIWNITNWDLVEDYMMFTCTLTVERIASYPKQKKSFTQLLKVTKAKIPIFEVVCLENCSPGNPYKETVLSIKCIEHCKGNRILWSITPPDPDVLAKFQLPANIPKDEFATKFLGRAFKPGAEIMFNAKITYTTANITVKYRVVRLKLNLTCQSNCKLYDPRVDIVIKAECCSYPIECPDESEEKCPCDRQDDCEPNDFDWKIRPVLGLESFLDATKLVLTIPAYTLEDKTEYTMTLESYDNSGQLSFVAKEPVANITLSCSQNGAPGVPACSTADERDSLVLTISCHEYCDNAEYAWTVEPNDVNFRWEDHTGMDKSALTIPAKIFPNMSNVTFTAVTGKATASNPIAFRELVPDMKIECQTNCMATPNPLKPTVLIGSCKQRCTYAVYNWTVEGARQPMAETWLSDDRTILTIPEDSINDDTEVSITLSSSSNNDKLKKKYSEPIPILTIECEENCGKLNPLVPSIIRVNCTEPNNESDICHILVYKWDLNPRPENFSWPAQAEEEGDTLKFKENSFADNDKVTVQVTARKGKASKGLAYIEPVPDIELKCEGNCEDKVSHPLIQVVFKIVCTKHCEGVNYIWTLEPLPGDFKWLQSVMLTENNDTLTIREDVFKDKDELEVKVVARKATKSFKTKFELVPPEISIICDPPCDSVFNPLHRVTLQANCTKYCMGKIEFEWFFEPLPTEFNWTKSIVMQINNESLLVLPEAFSDDSNVTVTVTDSIGKEGKGNATLKFVEPTPSISIGCGKNCWDGDPLVTTILIANCIDACDNVTKYEWALDPEPPNIKQNTSTGPLNISLTIKAETYKDGDDVNVTLTMRKANATATIKYFELVPELNVTCTEPCVPAHPLKNLTLTVKCVENCIIETYEWAIDPVPEKFDWKKQILLGPQNRTLTIAGYTFNDTNTTVVTVTNRKASKTITLNFVEPPAQINITCVFNCNDKLSNPLLPMMFNVSCTADCDRLKYLWYLLPPPPKDKWQSLVKYGKNNVTIYVKEGLYPDEGSTRVKVSSYKSEEYLDVHFVEPTPELKLEQNFEPDKCSPCNSTGCYPNPYEPISFNVSCVSLCQNISYTWDVNPMLRDSSWAKNIELPKRNITNTTLTIKKETYEDQENVLVTVRSRKGSASINLTYTLPPPVLTLKCHVSSNCSEANIFRRTSFTLKCKYECEKFLYEWKIDPPQPKPWSTYLETKNEKDGLLITVNKSSFKDNDTITFTAHNDKVEGNFTIHFVEFPPIIEIQCVKNCIFTPRGAIQLKLKCKDYCDELNFSWEMIPPSKYFPMMNETSDNIVIQNGSYSDTATVTANVKVRKSESNYTFTYKLPPWNGTCYIEPSNGTSGITKFAIECEDFTPEAMFRVYQKSPQDNTTGVLLTYGRTALTKHFLVSETDGVRNGIQVLVGFGWDTKATVELVIKSTALTPPKSSNMSRKDFIKTMLIDNSLGSYQDLLHRKQYFPIVQMASFLATALKNEDEAFERHYIKHLYAGLLEVTGDIAPPQIISLLKKIISGLVLKDPLVVNFATKLVRNTSEQMVRSNMQQYDTETIIDFANKTLTLTSKLLSASFTMQKELETREEPLFPDYPMFTELHQPRADIIRMGKIITVDLFAATAAVATIMEQAGSKNLTSGKINVVAGHRKLSSTENIVNFSFPLGGSYILSPIHFPQVLQKLYNVHNVTLKYRLVTFGLNPHWWNPDNLTLSTETLELSIPNVSRVPDPYHVYLKVQTPLEPKEENVNGAGLIIKEYVIANQSLFTATFKSSGKPYNVSLGNKEPNAGNFAEFSHTITDDKTLSFYSSTNVYVGVNTTEGVSSYSYTYIAADCYYWADGELAWKKDACAASPQLNPNYILCKCHHLSYFAARKYIPQLVPQGPSLSAGPIERNWVLTMATLALVVIFLLLLCWGHQQDEAFKAENVLHVLKDTIPGDKELYMVLIATGVSRDAGTTADVGISVKGSLATSRLHLLRGQNINLERNKEHFFIMYSPKYLGHLQSIKLWHNSQGKKPHWYCERVMIQHVKSREKYNFVVEQWFSLIRGNQTTHGMFKVSEKTQKMTFIRRVRETARADHHLLSLVFQRPRAGSYKETLMIGFVSCLTLMTITMLFVKMLDDVSGVMMVVIGLGSAVFTMLINILLQFLFRNTP